MFIMGRKGDTIWEHWTIHEQPNPKKMSMDKMKCNYCDVVQCRNTLRSKKHTVRCAGAVPEDVRLAYQEELDDILRDEANGQRRPYVRQTLARRPGDDDDAAQGTSNGRRSYSGGGLENRKAAEIISDLLQLNDSSSVRKRPLSQYTDEDLAREEKELQIKKARAEIRHLQAEADLCERLLNASDKIEPFLNKTSELIDLIVAEKTHSLVPVEVMTMHMDTRDHMHNHHHHLDESVIGNL